MNPNQLEQEVMKLIDNHVDKFTAEQYVDFLGNLIGNLEMREEVAKSEIGED